MSKISTNIYWLLPDDCIELSNNRAERSINPFVIGRKNWLFCNTPGGAKSFAAIYILIQAAMENGINPIQQRNDSDNGKMFPWPEEIPESCKMLINQS